MLASTTSLPAQYTLRHATTQDIPALIELVAAVDVSEVGEADHYTAEDLTRDWDGLDLAKDTWIVEGEDSSIAAYAMVRDFGHGQMNADVYIYPRHQGKGLGRALIRLTEARARELVPNAPNGARVVLSNHVVATNPAACALLEAEGYGPERYFWRMRIDLEGEPAVLPLPTGVTVRTYVLGQDERATYEAVEEAFADHWGHTPYPFEQWVKRTERSDFDPSLWLLAEEDGKLAGFCLCSNTPDVGWINTLGVRRPWRRHGLGDALLRLGFAELYRRGQRKIVLGVDAQSLTGATRLYERAGMRVAMRFVRFQKALRPGVDLSTQALADEA
jgi:mycothiol synthase